MDWTRRGFGGGILLSGGKDYNLKFDVSQVVDKSKLVIIFWVINNSKYGKLRQIEGCIKLDDLKATTSDIVHIQNLARSYGVEDENIYRNSEPSMEELKKNEIEIRKKSRRLTDEGRSHLVMVYCGGHGATREEKQIYLLNNEDPKKAVYPLETKLRDLVRDEESLCRVCAIYDCCRMRIEDLSGLNALYKGVGQQEDVGGDDEEAPCRYFHVQACGPGGIADADAGFAKKIFDHSEKFAQKNPVGFVTFPSDFIKV